MRRTAVLLAACFASAAAAQSSMPRVQKVSKPAAAGIIVQGGLAPPAGCGGDGGAVAIGPKPDDPAPPPQGHMGAMHQGALAIGPKQDDPAPPPQSHGMGMAGTGAVAIGPKQDDPAPPPQARVSANGALAIGPKQDDPAPPPPSRCMPAKR